MIGIFIAAIVVLFLMSLLIRTLFPPKPEAYRQPYRISLALRFLLLHCLWLAILIAMMAVISLQWWFLP